MKLKMIQAKTGIGQICEISKELQKNDNYLYIPVDNMELVDIGEQGFYFKELSRLSKEKGTTAIFVDSNKDPENRDVSIRKVLQLVKLFTPNAEVTVRSTLGDS